MDDALYVWTCSCGATQAMTKEANAIYRQTHATFYCVHGHLRHYPEGESEEDKLRRERDSLADGEMIEKDFGESFIESQGVTLSCRNIAPGLTLHQLAVAFEKAKNEAEPGDEVAGNPSKWPNVRGIQAVADAMNNAYAAYNPNDRLREALEGGTISQTSFDGHAVRIDFETREEANDLTDCLIAALSHKD